MVFKQVPVGQYFRFFNSSQVWLKVTPRTIQRIGETKAIPHTKNLSVFLIGDMEEAIKKSKRN